MSRFRFVVFACVLLNYGIISAQDRHLPLRLHSMVSSRFPTTRCPGLSVAVSSRNKIIFSQAFGKADLEQNVPLTNRSAHRFASLSKPITATIIMELVQSGRMSLDGSIREYLPELPETYREVTIRHLLTHQSGARGYRNVEETAFSVVRYPSTREAIKAFTDDPLLFPPGTKTDYSSYGFALLGAAAESATGRKFQELSADFFARHRISFRLDDSLELLPGRVRGYLIDKNGKVWNARPYDLSIRYPSTGFVGSAEEYLRFVISVSSGQLLDHETVRVMWQPQKVSNGKPSVFGLGWGVGEVRGNRMVGHNGLLPGSATYVRFFPDAGVGVVVACNAEGARDLNKMLDGILELALPTKRS